MQLAAKKTGDKAGEATRSPASYLDDRMEDGEFRVDRSIYLDDALFDQEMKPLGITRSQWWVLAQLSRSLGTEGAEAGMAQTKLARILDMGKAPMTGLIDRLEASGVDKDYRGREKASDHAPTWVQLRAAEA